MKPESSGLRLSGLPALVCAIVVFVAALVDAERELLPTFAPVVPVSP